MYQCPVPGDRWGSTIPSVSAPIPSEVSGRKEGRGGEVVAAEVSNGQTETCVLESTPLRALIVGRLGQATPVRASQEARRMEGDASPAFKYRASVYVVLVGEEGGRGSEKGALSDERTEAHPRERPRTHAAAHPAWWASRSGHPTRAS